MAGALDVVRAGLAERAVRARVTIWRDGARRTRGWRVDLHHVRRSLVRRPGLTAGLFLTLAIGIGINAASFSLVNAVLLRPLPYRDPGRLGFVWTKLAWIGVPRAWMSGPHIDLLKRDIAGIEDIATIRTQTDDLTGRGAPQLLHSGVTSSNLFDVLGVRPMLGRGFSPADAPESVAVVSYDLWRQFGNDPTLVGQSIDLSGRRTLIIGVLPETCRFLVDSSLGDPVRVDVWLPTDWKLSTQREGAFQFAALVRIKPGFMPMTVQAQLNALGARLDRADYHSNGFGWEFISVREDLVQKVRPALVLLAIAAGCLLIVVCGNVAGLMLARATERRREFSVRVALGAGHWDIVRLVLIEGLALAVTAGLTGGLVAMASMRVVMANGALPVPRLAEVSLDWRVLAFTLGLSVATGLVFALIPAILSMRTDAAPALSEGARGSSGRTHWLRSALVTGEIALAVVFVASALLLYRSYAAAHSVDPGFDDRGVLTADVLLHESRFRDPARITGFGRTLLDRLVQAPDVAAVGLTSSAPLAGNTVQQEVRVVDGPSSGARVATLTDLMWASPGYFEAMRIPIRAGRGFTWSDGVGAEPVAIVDERFARISGLGDRAVGHRISVDDGPALTIVGVVAQARQYSFENDGREQVYRAFAQAPGEELTVVLRSTGDPARLGATLRRIVGTVNPLQPIANVQTMAAVTSDALAPRRLQLLALGAFAIGALVLAALGIYGVLSSLVAERSREIGIRVALGASTRQVRRVVLRQGLRCAGAGAVLGIGGAIAASRFVATFLFDVSPRDPWSLTLTVAVLAVTAALATYGPARRAARVDPAAALRAQ